MIALFHVFFVGPLLIYTGLQKNLSHQFYQFLFFLGIGVILLHLYKGIKKLPKFAYFNYMHALLFGPLLAFIGYYESKDSFICNIVTLLGVLVIIYHGIKFLKK